MKKLYQKTLYVTLCFILGLCLLTACGKDKDTQEDDRQTTSSPVTSKEPENTSESMEDDTDKDADITDDEKEKTDDEENKKDDKEKEEDTSHDSSSIQTGTAKGYMNGFADSHTVEITLDNGDISSYQVYDEDILAKLEGYDTGSTDDTFSFTYTEEDGYLTIISVD